MIIVKDDASCFSFDVVGYQYSHSKDIYDSNWLIVKMAARVGELYWCATDACLRTFELLALKEWLQDLSCCWVSGSQLRFTEGEIGFLAGESGVIDVVLDFGFHPLGGKYRYGVDSEFVLSFKVFDGDLKRLIRDIDMLIEKFPVRH
ncbi:MAG: hypothetical protein AB7E55_03745 [Pigmentiphaga sp.]|uniref:WapI family immunity protein n=1 Tax=Pseudomonas sp. NBRC 100443 TaxID=1113665 RepID=UPI0024A03DB4|nr:hypothetical protein [Pseudomonas sp. NBRC 100443]GLU36057.1 hypothetical protein Pssp01_01500 [Pseudomonas sp. NBRC 100443]